MMEDEKEDLTKRSEQENDEDLTQEDVEDYKEENKQNNADIENDSDEKNEEESPDEETTSIDKEVKNLEEKIEQITIEKDELYDRMLRIQAEYENFKRRTNRERAAERKYRSQNLAKELLPALDNFERALAIEETEENKSIIEGITMVYEQIKEALKAEGIEPIQSVGEEFDPNLHHAVMQVEDEDKESNIIVEELQKGYILSDRVIRAAMVKVNK